MIKDFSDSIRRPVKDLKFTEKVINTFLILMLGITLGIFSKWLDNLPISDSIWWQRILGVLGLGNIFSDFGVWMFLAVCISVYSNSALRAGINVFLFFAGMNTSYHLYTITFSGFNPSGYMKIWYGLTLITPVLAFICWYAKGNGKTAFIINTGILAVMCYFSFGIGMWYFDFRSITDTLLFAGTVIVLYTGFPRCVFTLAVAVIAAFALRVVLVM